MGSEKCDVGCVKYTFFSRNAFAYKLHRLIFNFKLNNYFYQN